MVIDFHTHVFPDKIAKPTIESLAKSANNVPYTDGTVQGLIDHLEYAKVDLGITLPVLTKPTQFDSVTRFVCGVNENYFKNNSGLLSFGGIHPDCDDIDCKMRYLKSLGIRGVKIHPDYQNTFIDSDGYIQILECAKKLDMIVVTHSGVDDGYLGQPVKCPPEKVLKVIEKVGHEKFVLGHYGAHKQWGEVLNVLASKKVYFDTAYTLHEIDEKTFKDILYKHGDDRILFATDCPWRDVKEDLSILRSYNLGKETEDKILYKNAIKLLGI